MSGNWKKRLWSVLAIVAGVGLVICLFLLFRPSPATGTPQLQAETQVPTASETPAEATGIQTVEIPVDFEQLQEKNPDIYAWIQVPGTVIDYPIVQRFGDDNYYVRRDINGNYAIAGSLFTEYRYNVTDFSDPVTVIYGHDMNDGSMFGSLQTYCETLTLDENAVFYIYQPGRRLTYRIFAAVPYNNSHILYYNNFRETSTFERFFEEIYETRSLYANFAPDAAPSPDDKVVILATCLKGDNTQRFLVMGVLTEDTLSEPS